MSKIDGSKFKEILEGGVKALELNKSTIDELNVFPVPDGDTGTNMSLTLASALREAKECDSVHAGEVAIAFSKGALRGARGNSGVITSQIFKGFANVLQARTEITPKVFADCLKCGTEIAYSAVKKAKEGTILTVVRCMAEAAMSLAKNKKIEFDEFLKKVVEAGEEILQKTPEMLPILMKAGVVDAGGRGLVTVFDGMYRTYAGLDLVLISGESVKVGSLDEDVIAPLKEFDSLENDYEHITFQYCTEYFITHLKKEVTVAGIDNYRDYLMTIGDCVLVINDVDLIKTHVHTNHPDRALKAALELGELEDVKIENMMEQYRKNHANDEKVELKENAVVAICSGQGMADIFKDLGVNIIVEGGQTMNSSVDEILAAINDACAKNVFVLPNNGNIILAANQAKELSKYNVMVLPTKNMPEGISAMLNYDETLDAETNFETMNSSFANVCVAEITHAVRSTRMNRFSVKEGDVIGIADKKIVAKSTDLDEAVIATVRKMSQDKVMLTMYYGEEVSEEQALGLQEKLSEKFPELEVAVYNGGQPHYAYIMSAE